MKLRERLTVLEKKIDKPEPISELRQKAETKLRNGTARFAFHAGVDREHLIREMDELDEPAHPQRPR